MCKKTIKYISPRVRSQRTSASGQPTPKPIFTLNGNGYML